MTTIRGALIWLGLALGLFIIDPAWSTVAWTVLATLAVIAAAVVWNRRRRDSGPRIG
jgi:membrane protein implicated in regulation of membrane protease activity